MVPQIVMFNGKSTNRVDNFEPILISGILIGGFVTLSIFQLGFNHDNIIFIYLFKYLTFKQTTGISLLYILFCKVSIDLDVYRMCAFLPLIH